MYKANNRVSSALFYTDGCDHPSLSVQNPYPNDGAQLSFSSSRLHVCAVSFLRWHGLVKLYWFYELENKNEEEHVSKSTI